MFSPRGPSLRELARQALSSVAEDGYDLLAPKFDHTPFRTPDGVLDATAATLRPLGPFGRGLDVCCGTGAGTRVLGPLCQEPVTGVDFSAGMLAQARGAHPEVPVGPGPMPGPSPSPGLFDLAVSFGALGHFLPAERPALFAATCTACAAAGRALRLPNRGAAARHLRLVLGAARVRPGHAGPQCHVASPRFVMYYRTCPLDAVRSQLTAPGFTVTTLSR